MLLAGAVAASAPRQPRALTGRHFVIGLQLYSIEAELKRNFYRSLHTVSKMGYQEIELAGDVARSSSEWKNALGETGLTCVSTHNDLTELRENAARIIQFSASLGARYVTCSFPWIEDSARFNASDPAGDTHATIELVKSMSLNDWHWNADQLNSIGEQVRAAGMRLAYHNHGMEFVRFGNIYAYDELIKRTQPELVSFELDCGPVIASGIEPERIIAQYPQRIRMLHLQDAKALGDNSFGLDLPVTDLGSGITHWRPLLSAAEAAGIEHYFVEEEAAAGRSPWASLRKSYAFLRKSWVDA